MLIVKPDCALVDYRPSRSAAWWTACASSLRLALRRSHRHQRTATGASRHEGQSDRDGHGARFGKRDCEALSDALLPVFHRPADFRGRAFDRRLAGGIAMFALRSASIPRSSRLHRGAGGLSGANPRVLRRRRDPLEEQINGVENMLYMSSQATSDGVLTLTVTFRIGTDVDLAQVQVQNRVSQALPRLPEEVRQLGVTTGRARRT